MGSADTRDTVLTRCWPQGCLRTCWPCFGRGEASDRPWKGFRGIGHSPGPPRASTQPVDSIQAEIPYFNTKCWGWWHVHLGPREKYVCDLNSWPFPAAVPGLLGLDQKSRKGSAEEHRRAGRACFICIWGGSLSLVSPTRNSLAPSLACILGSPRCLFSIKGGQWLLAGLAMWQNSLSFCPKATWSLAWLRITNVLSPFIFPSSFFLSFRGTSPQKKGITDWWIFSSQQCVWNPLTQGLFTLVSCPNKNVALAKTLMAMTGST